MANTNTGELLNTLEVCDFLGVNRSHLHVLRREDPTFPKPHYMSERRPRWFKSDLVEWIRSKPTSAPSPFTAV